jgi:hypothetical protein
MPRVKIAQEERLFSAVRHRGAYGHSTTYEPVDSEAVPTISDETAHALGETAIVEGPEAELERRRERFRQNFSDKPWVPRSKREMTLALQTLPVAIDHIADRMHRYNQPVAREMYGKSQAYHAEASIALQNIDDAYLLEGDIDPSLTRIRDVFNVRMMVAEYILARESMDKLQWMPRKGHIKSKREKRLLKIMDELANKSSGELLQDWTDARESFQNEANFWYEQMMKVQDSQRVQEIQSENRTRRV